MQQQINTWCWHISNRFWDTMFQTIFPVKAAPLLLTCRFMLPSPCWPPCQRASEIILRSIFSLSAASLSCTLPYSDTFLPHANISTTELFKVGEIAARPTKEKHSSLFQPLSMTPTGLHTRYIWDVELQAWMCKLASHFAILVRLGRFFTVVHQKLLPVDAASYSEEASWESSTNSQGDPFIYKQQQF